MKSLSLIRISFLGNYLENIIVHDVRLPNPTRFELTYVSVHARVEFYVRYIEIVISHARIIGITAYVFRICAHCSCLITQVVST